MTIKDIEKLYRKRVSRLSADDRRQLSAFLVNTAKQITLIGSKEKKALLCDYWASILYYIEHDYSIDFIIEHLDSKKLGTFYKQKIDRWFSLDHAARVHSLTISKNWMSVFRLSFDMKESIVPELLQMAMNYTIKRFPLFSTTIKRGFFWNYIDTLQHRYKVEAERNIPCSPLKVSRSNTPSLRVVYHKKRVSIEYFHILTDGLGGMVFLKTLVAEYLNLLGKTIIPDETIFDINDTPNESEWENGYAKAEKQLENNQNKLLPKEQTLIKPALKLEGKLSRVKPYRILHFEMNSRELKQLSDNKGVKVTTLILGFLVATSIESTRKKKGLIKIQVPVNMRPYYNSNTIANFTQYCIIKIEKQNDFDFNTILKSVETQLIRGTSADVQNQGILRTKQLVTKLKWIPLSIKRIVFRLVSHTIKDRVFIRLLYLILVLLDYQKN